MRDRQLSTRHLCSDLWLAQEGAVGELLTFGPPRLRVRRKPIDGFCVVTVLPGPMFDDGKVAAASAPVRRGTSKLRPVGKRPTGLGGK
jgi:hypothetical protein